VTVGSGQLITNDQRPTTDDRRPKDAKRKLIVIVATLAELGVLAVKKS